MATMTIAQALNSTDTGITIADTPVNIARAVSNTALMARVAQFTLNANGASSAGDAATLATLGGRFSTGGFRYTVRDSIAELTKPAHASGLTIATVTAVFDTAANLLAAAGTQVITRAASVLLSTSATLTLANLTTLQAMPAFSVLPGQFIEMADTAANLLAIAPSQMRATMRFFTVTANATVSEPNALRLFAFAGFSIAPGARLTIDGSLADMTTATVLGQLPAMAVVGGVAVTVTDTYATLIGGSTALASLRAAVPNAGVVINNSVTVGAAELVSSAAALRNFSVVSGQAVTVADTAANLIGLQTEIAALAQASRLTADAAINVAQALRLGGLPGFSRNGRAVTVADTAGNFATSRTALVAIGAFADATFTLTDPAATVTAATAGALLDLHVANLSALTVSDTGAALTAAASRLFGADLTSIVVASGTFAGTLAQLLDPRLHFGAPSEGIVVTFAVSAHATLAVSTTAGAAQAVALSLLPGFSVAPGVSLTISDTADNLVAAAAAVGVVGTDIVVVNSAVLSAADATALAVLRAQVGAGHFDLTGHTISIADTPAEILSSLNAPGLSLSTAARPSAAASVDATQAAALVALGSKFSLGGFGLTVIDTQTALATLAGSSSALAGVNAWHGQVVLADDAVMTVAEARALLSFTGFSAGSHSLTETGSAPQLLDSANTAALALADTVRLSASATVTVAQAVALAALHHFTVGSATLTIADTPAHLAGLSSTVAGLAATLGIVARDGGNASDFILTAQQAAALATLPNLSLTGLSGSNQLRDTASGILSLASAIANAPSGSLLTRLAPTLSADAALSPTDAATLVGLSGFSLGDHVLTISGTPSALLSPSAASAIALASSVTLDAPATVSPAIATQLAALHGFHGADGLLSIAGTPAQIADLSGGVAALADRILLLAATDATASSYILTAARFNAMVAQPHLSLTGFADTLTVRDTGANLIALSTALAGAQAGSALFAAREVLATTLTADVTVTASNLTALASLPHLGLGGHNVSVVDTPTALIAAFASGTPLATSVTLVTHGSIWTVSAGDARLLVGMPAFSVGADGMRVTDTAENLVLSANRAGVLAAVAVALTGNATVSAVDAQTLHVLPGFSLAGHTLTIVDNAAHLAGLGGPTAALATSVLMDASAMVSVDDFVALRSLAHFSLNGFRLTVADTAANLATLVNSTTALLSAAVLTEAATLTADEAQALTTLPGFQAAAGLLTIRDTAAHLLAGSGALPTDWAGELAADSIVLSADASVTADQAVRLGMLGTRVDNGGHALIVRDAPSSLLNGGGWASILTAITGFALSGGSAWTVSADTASRLAGLAHFSTGPGMIVSDTVPGLLATSAASGLALASSVVLSADQTTNVTNATLLHGIAGFSAGTHGLTIADAAARLATLDSGTAALASAIQLSAPGIVNAAQFAILRALPHFSTNGQALTVVDTAANLVALATGDVSQASMLALSANATLTADQAEALVSLPHFSLGVAHIAIGDTAEELLFTSHTGALPDDWDGELAASSIALTANATVTAAQASTLALLGVRLSLNGHTLTVADTAANLLASNNAAGLALASVVTPLSGAVTLDAATATRLAAIHGFAKGGAVITVSDSAEALLSTVSAPGMALADHIQLASAQSLTVGVAASLIGHSLFQTNAGAALTIADSFAHLLGLGSTTLSVHNANLRATPIMLSEDAVATVAQMTALRALPQYNLSGHAFSRNGHALEIHDTGARIAAFAADGVFAPSAFVLTGDATVSATQANQLAAKSIVLDGNALTLSATAAQLADSANAAGRAIATTLTLSTNAAVTAAAAEALVADARFTTGGRRFVVTDTAEHILGLQAGTAEIATGFALIASQSLNAATLSGLALLGVKLNLSGASLTLLDTAQHLASTNGAQIALTVAQHLSADATVGAATATALSALPAFSVHGHTLTVRDSAAALLNAVYADGIALADAIGLTEHTVLTVAGAAALIGLARFVADPDAAIEIVDTAANLLGLADISLTHHDSVLRATPIGLSADAIVTVAELTALSALPEISAGFDRHEHTLVLRDSAQHILTYGGSLSPTAILMVGDATVTAAQADTLANAGLDLNGNTLMIADTPAELLRVAGSVGGALASRLVLSADVSVDAATAVALLDLTGFSTGGHRLDIRDTAETLVGLTLATQIAATTLVLSASQTVNAETLLDLARLGIKFDRDGHGLTVSDTAAALADLNDLEIALTVAQVLNSDAVVDAAVATLLADLPALTLADGVTLTVQDSVANLLGLSEAVLALATTEQLAPGATVSITAEQAAGLHALPHFNGDDATITVVDSIAHLLATETSGWSAVADFYIVSDTISHIVAAVGDGLLTGAQQVRPSSDAQIDAAAAHVLAGLSNFTHGDAVLTVVDGPAEIADHADDVLAVANAARINVTTAILASQALALAGLDDAGLLTFASGVHIVIEDSLAALTEEANADGLALADTVTVLDTAANLVSAQSVNWGDLTPLFKLTASADIDGPDAGALAAVVDRLSFNGHTLTMVDDAETVVLHVSALLDLGILARVVDTAAAATANATGLIGLGGRLAELRITDTDAVDAAAAAGLVDIAVTMTGEALRVADDAEGVNAVIDDLLAMGAHLHGVVVTDAAADIADVAAALADLGTRLTVHLTDTDPILAADAAGLSPLVARLDDAHVAVSDTAAHVAAVGSALADLGGILTTVALTDGPIVEAAVVAGLVPVMDKLTADLAVVDTAAAIVAATTALHALRTGGALDSIRAANDTAAHILTHAADLADLDATATIRDTAAHVLAALDALTDLPDGLLDSITLTDSGTPTLTMTVAQLTNDFDVIATIASAFHIAIADTGAHISADLASGDSAILAHIALLSSIVPDGGGTIELSASRAFAGGVDDGVGSALAKLSGGSFHVSGVAVADIAGLAALGVPPDHMTIVDTAAHIQADLASGGSDIVANLAAIGSIHIDDAGAITLTADRILASDVDDGAGSAAAKLTGGTLLVSGATVAQFHAVASLGVVPDGVAVADTAAHIQADLIDPDSELIAHRALLTAVANDDAGTIALTATQVLAAHVNDGAGSVLSFLTGGLLRVTDTTVAQIDAIAHLGLPPDQIVVADTAAHIQADLALGEDSAILGNLDTITAIQSGAGTIELTAAQVLTAGVDDGAGSALAMLSGADLVVTDVAVAQIDAVLGLGVAPEHIAISDTAAHVQADLTGGTSAILANLGDISAVSVSDAGAVRLSLTLAQTAGVADGAGSFAAKLAGGDFIVTGVAVADLDSAAALASTPDAVEVADTAAQLQADLTGGSSRLMAHRALLGTIVNTDIGTISLTTAQITAAHVADAADSVLALLDGGQVEVTDATVADLDTLAALFVPPHTVIVDDSAAHIQTDLAAGAGSALVAHLSMIAAIHAGAGTITLTASQVLAEGVDDGSGSALAKLSGADLVVTGVSVAQIAAILALGVPPDHIVVSDTAAHIQADLIGGSSALLANIADISSIVVSDAGSIALTGTQAHVAGVADGPGSALAKLSGGSFVVSGLAIADIDDIFGLSTPPDHVTIDDTAANIQADLISGSSDILANLADIGSINVGDHGAIFLTVAQFQTTGISDSAGSALAKLSGGSVTVTDATIAELDTTMDAEVPPDHVAVTDTGAHIQADLTGGSSILAAHVDRLTGILNSDADGLSLTEAQVRAAHVNDGAASVLAKMSGGGSLTVTGVLAADVDIVAGLYVPPTVIRVHDTAAHIQSDLAAGLTSHILANLSTIASIESEAGTISLTLTQVLVAGVNDGGPSALSKLSGATFIVTDVPMAQFNNVLGLSVPPDIVAIADTAVHIQADLLGAGDILSHLSTVSAIVVTDAGTIRLGSAAIQTTGMADGGGSVLAKLSGGTVVAEDIPVADVHAVADLFVSPSAIEVADTAAHIQSDLTGGSSVLVTHRALLSALDANDAGVITLTETQVLAEGVDDGTGSVLSHLTGGTLVVTEVLAANVDIVANLGKAPDHIAVSDTAAHIATDLALGEASHILGNLSSITAIVSAAGTISLTAAQALAEGVDDGAGSALAKLSGGTFVVTNVTVAQIATVLALGVVPDHIVVSDTAAHIKADLLGTSVLLANLADISEIVVSDAAAVALTLAEASVAGIADGVGSAMDKLSGGDFDIVDAAVADLDAIAALATAPDHIALSDTAANITADLIAGTSDILTALASVSVIDVSDEGTIVLTHTQASRTGIADGGGSVHEKLSGGHVNITELTVAQVPLWATVFPIVGLFSISDTAAHIQADLAGGSSDLAANWDQIIALTNSDAGTIVLTESQVRAAHVNDGAGSVLSHLSGGSLTVTDVLVADLELVAELPVAPDHMVVGDTAAHIALDLAAGAGSHILENLASITSIVSGAGDLTLTAAQALFAGVDDGVGSALAKLSGGTLVVSDVTVAQIATILALDVAPDHILLNDTAAHIRADLIGSSDILANLSDIAEIQIGDGGLVVLTVAQILASGVDDGAGSALSKLSGGLVAVTGAAVADLDTLTALGVVPDIIAVSDTAAHIAADLASGTSDLVAGRTLLGMVTVTSGTISLTESQVLAAHVNDGAGSVFSHLSGGGLLVTQVTVAHLAEVANLPVPPTTIRMSDTVAHIQTDLAAGAESDILASLGTIDQIAATGGGSIVLTAAQALVAGVADSGSSAMSFVSGAGFHVTHATVAQLGSLLALGVPPTQIAILDTAAHIEADLTGGSSTLLAHLASLSGIAISDSGTIHLTGAQALLTGVDDGDGSVIDLLSGGDFAVTDVAVADIDAVFALDIPPDHINVLDTAAHLLADLGGGTPKIVAHAAAITTVTPADATISAADAATLYSALVGLATFDESDVTVTGTASALLSAYGVAHAILTNAHAVTMTGNPTGVTAANATILSAILGGALAGGQTLGVADTATNLLLSGNLAGIVLATETALVAPQTVTAAIALQLASLPGFNSGAQPLTVADTVNHLLDPDNGDWLPSVTYTQLSGGILTGAQTLSALADLPGFSNGGHALVIGDTVAHVVALTEPELDLTTGVVIIDTSASVSAALNTLKSTLIDPGHSLTINLTDGVADTPSITLTATTYASASAVIDAISIDGVARVIGTASQIAALRTTLAADDVVGDVQVTDTAANILSNLTALNTLGSKFSAANLTNTTVSAVELAALLAIPNLTATSLTIADTGAQIAAAIAANGAPGLAFLNSHAVQLTGNSVVTAAEALSLQSLTALDKNGYTLRVWDTASHLTDSVDGYLAAVNNAAIDGVYLKTSGGTATVSASVASTLFSINNFSKNNPSGTTNVLKVQSTAAQIESAFATLNANHAAIDNVIVSAGATVTDAVYAHLLTLGATMALGANLTVRDTAANIAANALTQLGGSPSLTPTTWALSGSATVTAANAAIIGGLSGLSTGAFSLTLAADATGFSVTDANKLGLLGSAFKLGGHSVHVSGDVATVSGLSTAAKSIVTPDIVDTFEHVATLTTGTNLLGGTITITDSGTVTVSQANSFLALLKVGGGAGIPIANVDFTGHIESVTDTLSNIKTMTGSGGWTSNTAVHDDFNLVVADTVSVLINGTNTASLTTMNGTTFSSDQTTTAANATTLSGLADSIHFAKGSYTLTVSDTPTHLLDPSYADGLALADVWQLTADASVTSADAEALLSEAKFHLNHVLTVSDSSDNLLDGVLDDIVNASAYKADVHIELSGAETLDARTAARLVALPGYTDTGALSIEDGAAYLLNSANLAAETLAASVTLNGDETLSIATATKLAALPHFTLGSNTIILASNDYADAAALVAIASFASGFDEDGHVITVTQDALALTPSEYIELQDDGLSLNGHAISALATDIVITSGSGTVHVAGNGIDGATARVYASNGTLLSQSTVSEAFSVSASEGAIGNGVVVTEVVGASAATSESAPIIVLERSVLTTQATTDGATFAATGQVQVDTGKYVNLYTTATVPAHPANPVLVYDATQHTLSLSIDGHAPLVLVTLGSATTPAALDPSEIFIRHLT